MTSILIAELEQSIYFSASHYKTPPPPPPRNDSWSDFYMRMYLRLVPIWYKRNHQISELFQIENKRFLMSGISHFPHFIHTEVENSFTGPSRKVLAHSYTTKTVKNQYDFQKDTSGFRKTIWQLFPRYVIQYNMSWKLVKCNTLITYYMRQCNIKTGWQNNCIENMININ